MQKINISLGGNPYEIIANGSGEYKWIKRIPKNGVNFKLQRIESFNSLEQSRDNGGNFQINLISAAGGLNIYYNSTQQEQMIAELKLIERIIMGEQI
jgi:hypothetical protein